MIDADEGCVAVLNQLVSARRALKSLTEKIIEDHLEACIDPGNVAQAEASLAELLLVLKRYVE